LGWVVLFLDLGKWIITFKGIRSIAITASEWTASINGFNYDARTIVDFASPLSYDIDKIFRRSDDGIFWVGWFYFWIWVSGLLPLKAYAVSQ
jgi:hypothetical protein